MVQVVVEEFLDGEEASYFALCDGETAGVRTCVYVCVWACVSACVCVCVFPNTRILKCMCVCARACVCVCMCVCVCVCVVASTCKLYRAFVIAPAHAPDCCFCCKCEMHYTHARAHTHTNTHTHTHTLESIPSCALRSIDWESAQG